ncbi:unnamed protein product [Lactuca virosa]|uniref:Uncharacterized protein n=1 Tax=Lactuca virosa TaxID=75947 RepID=A0AAU9LGK0_9ASTR|nr:unnamed protein product [Lactuca virosa]
MGKVNTKITVDSFRATQPMPPPMPALRIYPVDERFPIKKTVGLPNQPLIPPFFEGFIARVGPQIISSSTTPKTPMKDKGKGISFRRISPIVPLKKKEGWSLYQIDQAVEESLKVQALKDNPNPFQASRLIILKE